MEMINTQYLGMRLKFASTNMKSRSPGIEKITVTCYKLLALNMSKVLTRMVYI